MNDLRVRKEQYLEWRDHPVTIALMAAIKMRVDEGKDHLIASNDPDFDRIIKGMLRAYKEILDHRTEFSDLLSMLEEVSEKEES